MAASADSLAKVRTKPQRKRKLKDLPFPNSPSTSSPRTPTSATPLPTTLSRTPTSATPVSKSQWASAAAAVTEKKRKEAWLLEYYRTQHERDVKIVCNGQVWSWGRKLMRRVQRVHIDGSGKSYR
eukprot:5938475-Pyramimonas_sp.AAC.1